jgi:cytoskeletal protein RodZ
MSATETASSGPGASLATAREQAGWSLVQAAERLHLDVAAVRALETGDYALFGAPVYARGHLRRYAELVGVSPDEVERAFNQAHSAGASPDLRRGAGLLQKSALGARTLRPASAAIGAIILVLIALIWWAMHVPGGRLHGMPAAAPPAGAAASAPAPTPDDPGAATHSNP